MHQRFRFHLGLPLLLVLTLVIPGVCGFLPESHACCHGHTSDAPSLQQALLNNADASCCFISTTQAATSQEQTLLPEDSGVAATAYRSPLKLYFSEDASHQRLLSHRFIADQSRRHQLLSVWLN